MKKRLLNQLESSDNSDAVLQQNTPEDPSSSATIDSSESQAHRLDTDGSEPSSAAYSPTTVYISGMPLKYCTDAVIEKIMSPYGTITRCSVHHTPPKPYAFCDFAESQQAREAIRAVHGRRLGGQPLVVRRAYRDNFANTTGFPVIPSGQQGNPKRPKQQLDAKIAAIQRKLARSTHPVSLS
jgi:RNA recognition motif-containing protein